ncbi:hypothetical protein K3495_g11313 [Podosphaera aphanis]|nr:hypothetical protein K3495_g11313 [Podosphaera aphanis]
MPNLAYPIILGKPWMERNKVIYAAEDHSLLIEDGGQKLLVRASGWGDKILSKEGKQRMARVRLAEESRISYSKLEELCDQVRMENSCPLEKVLGTISTYDLTKVLETKKQMPKDLVREGLPEEVKKFTDLFVEDGMDGKDTLAPFRPGVDTKVQLLKDEQGRLKEVPWGPLYGMSREELLVLRKTLTDLLD